MTHDPNLYITLALSGLIGLAMLTGAGLAGFRSWIAMKRQEIGTRTTASEYGERREAPSGQPTAASRIEIADLKERIRKLEAIAAGVDL